MVLSNYEIGKENMIPQYEPMIDRESLAKETSEYILGNGYFTEYKKTEEFEKKISDYLGVKHCVVVNNGTISLSLALLAMGIKAGDVVLIPNITMIATQNAVEFIGAKVKHIDVDPRNLCMDLEAAKEVVRYEGNVKAIIYVTLNGRRHSWEEYDLFRTFCQYNDIALLEDNAQSLGSKDDKGSMISSPINGIGSFSFSMPKIITTGQGGCLVTNKSDLAEKLRKVKDFGRESGGMDVHDAFGINSKFTEIQAIMGLNQMQSIKSRVFLKKEIYDTYECFLGMVPEIDFLETNTKEVTPWFVDIYVERRTELRLFLQGKGIGTRCIYPELTSQKINGEKSLTQSKIYGNKGLWLPSSMTLQKKDIRKICKTIKEFYGK